MVEGVEMYVARLAGSNGGYIVKRMPDTGSLHAPDCPSYEPPAEFSGLGQVLRGAITEDPVTGETTLRLDFPLTKLPGRSQTPPAGGASDDTHMVMIATFGVSSAGVPSIHELCLMPTTRQWLPVEDGFEKQLLDRLVGDNRAFVKGLHYNLGKGDRIASVALTDCEGPAPMLFIVPAGLDEAARGHEAGEPGHTAWVWRRSGEPMPPLPLARTSSPKSTVPAHG